MQKWTLTDYPHPPWEAEKAEKEKEVEALERALKRKQEVEAPSLVQNLPAPLRRRVPPKE